MKAYDLPFFKGFPDTTRLFYARLFWKMMLNAKAYQLGYFNVLLCNSFNDDDWQRFERSMSQIAEHVHKRERDGY